MTIDLNAIQKRCQALPEGMWWADYRYAPNVAICKGGSGHVVLDVKLGEPGPEATPEQEAVAEFVAHARTDLPVLLSIVRRVCETVGFSPDESIDEELLIREIEFLREEAAAWRGL